MNLFGVALFAAVVASTSALADVLSPHADSVAVTLYHDEALKTSQLLHVDQNPWIRDSGLAFITETRSIDLPAGPSLLKFQGVASTMVPQTADIQGLPASVLERNFDYDLLSPGSLLAKSIGESVRLVRSDKRTGKQIEETAIIRSGPDGAVFEIDGKFEALRCSGLPEKLVFDHVPDGLSDTPTLSVRTVAPTAGRYTIKLSYIATGLNWTADYVARIAPGSGRLGLTGWLTLANFSATSFRDAPVAVVAGNLETTGEDKSIHASPLVLATHCWPMNIDWATHRAVPLPPPPPPPPPPAPMLAMRAQVESVTVTAEKRSIEAQQLGDYKLYPLPEPTNVAARQTKQIQFLDQPDVSFERVYRYTLNSASDASDNFAAADVLLRLQNRADAGLGKPLPAGSVSVFEPGPDGNLIFAGQQAIGDISVGLPVEVETGRAMDVRVQPLLVSSTSSGHADKEEFRDGWEIALENDKPAPIRFEFRQSLYAGSGRIVSESQDHASKAGYAVWSIGLKAGERTVLRYTITH